MTYTAAEARQELLDAVAQATDDIGRALAALGAAYDLLDERSADRMEEELFGPVQHAYGRAQRTHNGFAERHGLAARRFAPAPAPSTARGARTLIDAAVEAVKGADEVLVTLQDSMKPVEVGDAELRAGLTEIRELLGSVAARARELERVLGR